MKTVKFISVLGFIFVVLLSTVLAEDAEKQKPEKMVWFDGTGAYHYDDPTTYMNDVLSGKIKDKEVLEILKGVCKEQKTVSYEQLPLIAEALDPLKHTFFLCYPDDKQIEKNSQKIREYFTSELESSGSLTIKTFSFESRGDTSIFGGSESNTLLAIPADPLILKNATNEMNEQELTLEKALRDGVKTPEWSRFAQGTNLPPTGTIYLFDLHAGPWVIYMDRHGLITQCYRVIIGAGYKNELVAERTCCPPRTKFMLKSDEQTPGE